MIIESPPLYKCNYITLGFATEPWQERQYWQVRKAIFCEEQRLFEGSDRDEIDGSALPIIAECSYAGLPDQVVGVVRIDQRKPGIWWGGRLGVVAQYRQLSRFNTTGLFNDSVPVHPFTMNIGGALIFKAVSTALALGCEQFFAYVQEQNTNFFRRMHWEPIGEKIYHGRLHHLMEADTSFYQPSLSSVRQLALKTAG